jgi:hypothetical protein
MNGVRILVLDRGFVVVGRVSPHRELAFHWLVSPCRTIRVWGTTNGLSELQGGPLSGTVLDPPCVAEVPWRAVIKMMAVEEDKWLPHLKAR